MRTQADGIDRRAALFALAAAGLFARASNAAAVERNSGDAGPMRLATAWRVATAADGRPPDRVGVFELDWAAGHLRVAGDCPVPTRAHGLAALPGGGFVAVAQRPGRWLLECDREGREVRRHDIEADTGSRRTFNGRTFNGRTFNGHVALAPTGGWLYTTETDPEDGSGWVSVRDPRTLRRVAQFASGGIEPHHLVTDPGDGTLWVANGGIPRDLEGRKVEREAMAPSLARLRPTDGHLLGHHTLEDPQLSIRHLAWSHGDEGAPTLLGAALQAEHAMPERRQAAPALALLEGGALRIATHDASAAGYAGDIAAGPGGGFVISAQKARRVLWWHAQQAGLLTTVAELTEPCALLPLPGESEGVLIGAGRGVARWLLRDAPGMLAWPLAMAPDNHAVLLLG